MFGFIFGTIAVGAILKDEISDMINDSNARVLERDKNGDGVYIDSKGKRRHIKTNRIVSMERYQGRMVYIDTLKSLEEGKTIILYDPDKEKYEQEELERKKHNDDKMMKAVRKSIRDGHRVIYIDRLNPVDYVNRKESEKEYLDLETGITFVKFRSTYENEYGEHIYSHSVRWKDKITGEMKIHKLVNGELEYLMKIEEKNRVLLR